MGRKPALPVPEIEDDALTLEDRVKLLERRLFGSPRVLYIRDAVIQAHGPQYAHDTDSGADICATEAVDILPKNTYLLSTGLRFQIPEGYELQARPKSGLATLGFTIINSPGTIDNGFRGEVMVICANIGREHVAIVKGQKICQLVLALVVRGRFKETSAFTDDGTSRGDNGLGSSGPHHEEVIETTGNDETDD
jgi:dUTP pyrophosphatase